MEKLMQFNYLYYKLSQRLSTFKDWPFLEDCNCTPQKMAEAGFVYQPCESQPDVAVCFFCFKELEGWEPNDNPWEEHQKHSRSCRFLTNLPSWETLTLEQLIKLENERMNNLIRKVDSQHTAEFEAKVQEVRIKLQNL
uniref:baculoviral IAP repeat-containing protein 5-like n=1 Tax=Myxine glutinosa TaxID=7769 RepID=UPI00358F596F